jgi:hypothetical protein
LSSASIKISVRKIITKWWPLSIMLILLFASFIYGWFYDDSIPQSGEGWKDQGSYSVVTQRFVDGELPGGKELHFTIGYSILGMVGYIVLKTDPFMIVSLSLLLASAVFCFLAVRHMFGSMWWSVTFMGLLFLWDGVSRSFHFASELFAVPWNNQVLFFTIAYYLWLYVTKLNKPASWRLVVISSAISGFSFLTREETILFVIPAMTAFIVLSKSGIKKLGVSYLIIVGLYIPQLIIKLLALGSVTSSGRSDGYGDVRSHYFRFDLLYRNIWETLINSSHFNTPGVNRQALFQAAPWLWLGPVGMGIILFSKKFSIGIKVFILISLTIMVFYLSGANMSAHKLSFHCLRYISSSFIALNLGVIVVARVAVEYFRSKVYRPLSNKL